MRPRLKGRTKVTRTGLPVVFVVTDRRGSDEVELVERCVGHLEGFVHNVRRVAQEERVILVGGIVRVDDFEHPRLEKSTT